VIIRAVECLAAVASTRTRRIVLVEGIAVTRMAPMAARPSRQTLDRFWEEEEVYCAYLAYYDLDPM
jgi:hypothetical protein